MLYNYKCICCELSFSKRTIYFMLSMILYTLHLIINLLCYYSSVSVFFAMLLSRIKLALYKSGCVFASNFMFKSHYFHLDMSY